MPTPRVTIQEKVKVEIEFEDLIPIINKHYNINIPINDEDVTIEGYDTFVTFSYTKERYKE